MSLRHLNIERGGQVIIQSRAYRFAGEVGREGGALGEPRDLSFKDVRTGAHITLALEAFDRLYAAGEVRVLRAYETVRDRPLDEATEAENEIVRWRRLWCEAFDCAPSPRSDRALSLFIAEAASQVSSDRPPPSAGALRAWLRERGAPGDRRARFMGQRRGAHQQPLRIHPTLQQILADQAETFFDGVQLNPASVYCAVRSSVVALNAKRVSEGLAPLRAPSASTIRRYLRRHMDYGRATRRYGYREGGRRFKPILGSMQADHILQTALIDQTLIDCMVIDDEHLINVGRPWLAVMIDVRSRYPLGFCLSFEPPSVGSVLACLRHGVRPKLEMETVDPELKDQWLGFGVPETVVVDNAWENTGSSFRDACADAGISIVYAPVATPEYKGVVERFFGTLNSLLFHRLPGGLPFTPQQRKRLGIDGEHTAALMLSDVRRAIYQCIVEVYGRGFHKALQASPEQVWRKDAALHGRPYVDDLASLDLALAKLVPGERTLSRAGIVLNDLTYRAPEPLAELLADLLPRATLRSARPGTAKVKIKHHPEDLGRIYVWNAVRARYVALPCSQPSYAEGLSEHHHGLIRAFARAEHLAFQNEDERCAARVRLQEMIRSSVPLSKVRARQQAQRLSGERAMIASVLNPPAPTDAIPLTALDHRGDDGRPHRAPGRKRSRAKHDGSTLKQLEPFDRSSSSASVPEAGPPELQLWAEHFA